MTVNYAMRLASSLEFESGSFFGDLVLDFQDFTAPTSSPFVLKLPAVFVARKLGSKVKNVLSS